MAALLQPRGCLKGCPPGWAGHPFRGSEHAISKVCLFSSSTTLWTPWWVSLARNPSLKGRCLVGGGLGKSKRRTGGLRWISQVVYVKWLESNLPASHQAASDVKSSAQEGFLPQSSFPRRKAATAEVKERTKRTMELCYPEKVRGSP